MSAHRKLDILTRYMVRDVERISWLLMFQKIDNGEETVVGHLTVDHLET